ncbi:MAG: ABC transporter ATP-binding protein [Thermomicrobiales bacterium]
MIIVNQPTTRRSPTGGEMELLSVSHLSVSFDEIAAIRNVSLSVRQGEFVALLGPSGCGKSTLLNAVAGLVEPDSGEIRLQGEVVRELRGRVAYMPQRDALLPWRTVLENATLSAEVSGRDKAEARERAQELLPRFGLEGFGDSYPGALSGGMRQRAAFLRTVLSDREVMLLDEPFGALDALTRRSMQEWLLDLWNDLGRTILMVTHDVEEALLLADAVAVMTARPGTIKHREAVDLPRPRSADMIAAPAFIEQKTNLLAVLREELGEMGGRL